MGTRHLIAAVIDGELKFASYNQWDGYPSGAGFEIVLFLKTLTAETAMTFLANLRSARWLTEEEAVEIDEGRQPFPSYLSRDTGAEILPIIAKTPNLRFVNRFDFGRDSLFCEWAYVLDFDTNQLEVYRGFQSETPTEGRWAGLRSKDDSYGAVKLIKTYHFKDLPESISADLEPEDAED